MEFIFVFQKLHNHFISIPSQEKYESFRDAHGVYECHIFAFGFLIHLTDVRKFMKLDKSQAIARVWMLKSISYSTYFGTKSTELFFFFFSFWSTDFLWYCYTCALLATSPVFSYPSGRFDRSYNNQV